MMAEPCGTKHVPAGIHADFHDPGFDAAAAAELRQAPVHLQEGLLDSVLCQRHIMQVHIAHPFQRHLVCQNHLFECFFRGAGRARGCNHPDSASFHLYRRCRNGNLAFCKKEGEKRSRRRELRQGRIRPGQRGRKAKRNDVTKVTPFLPDSGLKKGIILPRGSRLPPGTRSGFLRRYPLSSAGNCPAASGGLR